MDSVDLASYIYIYFLYVCIYIFTLEENLGFGQAFCFWNGDLASRVFQFYQVKIVRAKGEKQRR